jgi:hypothetical protein
MKYNNYGSQKEGIKKIRGALINSNQVSLENKEFLYKHIVSK